MDVPSVLVLAFLAGAATLLGGLASIFLKIASRTRRFMLVASTGVVISIIMLGFLPSSLSLVGIGYTALGFVIGGIVIMITSAVFPYTYGAEKYEDKLYSILRMGSLVMTGLIIYSVPAGLLIGSGFAGSLKLGLAACIAIVLHNIPRGASIYIPLHHNGTSKSRIVLIMLLAGVLTLVGALVSFVALADTIPVILSTGLAFTAGAMFFISTDQLVPVMRTYNRRHEVSLALFLGVFVGILILGLG